VQAIFLHSVDENFDAVGRKSSIQYLKLFSTYKQIIMAKLIALEEDREFEEMIKWYNAQVFNWFNHNDKGDGPDSSGIDEVMTRMEDLDIEAQGDDEDQGADETHVCYHFLTLISSTDHIPALWGRSGTHSEAIH